MTLGPAALLRSIPGVLGRTPADELVLIGVTDLSPRAAVIVEVDLFAITNDNDAEGAAEAVADAITRLRADGVRKVVVLAYADDAFTPDSTPARYSATAVVHSEAAGLGVLDAVAVSHGRWRSYECDNPSCCPPDGHLITGEPTP